MKCKSKYPIRIKERREVKGNYRSYFLDESEILTILKKKSTRTATVGTMK